MVIASLRSQATGRYQLTRPGAEHVFTPLLLRVRVVHWVLLVMFLGTLLGIPNPALQLASAASTLRFPNTESFILFGPNGNEKIVRNSTGELHLEGAALSLPQPPTQVELYSA